MNKAPSNKGGDSDYVYFERSTAGFTSDAIAHSTAAKLKLVSYYKVAVDTAIERNARYEIFLTYKLVIYSIYGLDGSNWKRG